jgi:hypothetical protein
MSDPDPEQPSRTDTPANPYASPEADLSFGPGASPPLPDGERFSAARVVARTWALFKERSRLVFGLVSLPIWISLLYQLAGQSMAESVDLKTVMGGVALTAFVAAGFAVQMWLTGGMTMALIGVARGEDAQMGNVFQGGPYVLRMIGASLLFALAVAVLLAVCLAPAGILALAGHMVAAVAASLPGFLTAAVLTLLFASRFYWYTYLIIDHEASVIESLRESYALSRTHTLELAVLLLIGFVVHLCGGLAMLVGSVANVIVSMVCLIAYLFALSWITLLFACTYVALNGEQIGPAMSETGAGEHRGDIDV